MARTRRIHNEIKVTGMPIPQELAVLKQFEDASNRYSVQVNNAWLEISRVAGILKPLQNKDRILPLRGRQHATDVENAVPNSPYKNQGRIDWSTLRAIASVIEEAGSFGKANQDNLQELISFDQTRRFVSRFLEQETGPLLQLLMKSFMESGQPHWSFRYGNIIHGKREEIFSRDLREAMDTMIRLNRATDDHRDGVNNPEDYWKRVEVSYAKAFQEVNTVKWSQIDQLLTIIEGRGELSPQQDQQLHEAASVLGSFLTYHVERILPGIMHALWVTKDDSWHYKEGNDNVTHNKQDLFMQDIGMALSTFARLQRCFDKGEYKNTFSPTERLIVERLVQAIVNVDPSFSFDLPASRVHHLIDFKSDLLIRTLEEYVKKSNLILRQLPTYSRLHGSDFVLEFELLNRQESQICQLSISSGSPTIVFEYV